MATNKIENKVAFTHEQAQVIGEAVYDMVVDGFEVDDDNAVTYVVDVLKKLGIKANVKASVIVTRLTAR